MAGKKKKNKNRPVKPAKADTVNEEDQNQTKNPREAEFLSYFGLVVKDVYAREWFPGRSFVDTNRPAVAELYKRLKDWDPKMTRDGWKRLIKKQKKLKGEFHANAVGLVGGSVDLLMKEEGEGKK